MKVVAGRPARILPAMTVIGTVLIAGCGGAASRLNSHMERGRAYYTKGDFAHASIEFRNALQIAPKDLGARLMAAHTLEKLNRLNEAAGLYQAVIDSNPDNIEARANLGRMLVFAGAPERAKEVIEPGLAKFPDDASLLTVRSTVRLRMNDTAGAVADADHALKSAPANEDAIAVRAGLYKQAGDSEHAIKLVSDGVQRQPASAELREILYNLYQAAGDQPKAVEQLSALIKQRPEEMLYRKQLAMFYARAGKLDDAQHTLEDAVKVLPKSDEAKLTLVSFIAAERTREQGEKTLRDFIAKDPGDYGLRFGLADLLLRNGARQAALDTYNEVIRRDDMGAQGLLARDRIAALELAQGHDEAAEKLIDQVLQKSPRDTDALLVRGELALKRKDANAAIADLRAVLRDQPGSAPVQRMLARAYVQNNELALAEQALRAAMDITPADTELRIELAKLLGDTQRLDQSIGLLEDTVRANPNSVVARESLVRQYLAKRDFRAARTAAEDLKTLRPDMAAGPYLAGVAAQGANDLDGAEKEFERARALQPAADEPLAALARLEVGRGRPAKAIELVQAAINADPKDAVRVNLLGELYLATKEVAKAIDTFRQATAVAPQWWLPYRNLALAKMATKDSAGAIAAYEAALKAAPTELQPVAELAHLYETLGRVDEAIARYESLLQHSAQPPVVANNLAMLLVTYKQDRQSLDRARDLTASFGSSHDSSLQDTFGWVRVKRGEYAQALPVLEQAAKRTPDQREIRYHLGMAALQSGQSDRARTELEAALSGSARYSWSDAARSALAGLKIPSG
jgi:tetratricopeptide (TPR) repeat protein